MKVVIPVAGVGSRFKPHTFSQPKGLMKVAGRELISFILDKVRKLSPDEIVFVLGHLKDKMKDYLEEYLDDENLVFVEQDVRNGDAGAVKIALDEIRARSEDDEVFVIFNDTIIDFNVKHAIMKNREYDGVVFCMRVDDPRHYGVVYTDSEGLINDVIEKPEEPESDLVIIGAYWFKSFYMLLDVINEVMKGEAGKGGEYRLADAIKMMTNGSCGDYKIKAVSVDKWFDCGRPEILLRTNEYLLSKMGKGEVKLRGDSVVIGPSFVARDAKIEGSVIGPYASVSSGAVVRNSVIVNSIVDEGAVLENLVIKDSIIGPKAVLKSTFKKLNVGEKSEIDF